MYRNSKRPQLCRDNRWIFWLRIAGCSAANNPPIPFCRHICTGTGTPEVLQGFLLLNWRFWTYDQYVLARANLALYIFVIFCISTGSAQMVLWNRLRSNAFVDIDSAHPIWILAEAAYHTDIASTAAIGLQQCFSNRSPRAMNGPRAKKNGPREVGNTW